MSKYKEVILLLSVFFIISCDNNKSEKSAKKIAKKKAVKVETNKNILTKKENKTTLPKSPKRWYKASQVIQGKKVFVKNCISCHGESAEGIGDWQKKLANGRYPAPPLNGTAHTWHHKKEQLLSMISKGSVEYGGEMPSFKDVISDKGKESVLAYIQEQWTDEIYSAWAKRSGLD